MKSTGKIQKHDDEDREERRETEIPIVVRLITTLRGQRCLIPFQPHNNSRNLASFARDSSYKDGFGTCFSTTLSPSRQSSQSRGISNSHYFQRMISCQDHAGHGCSQHSMPSAAVMKSRCCKTLVVANQASHEQASP
jgi:hypothetical protein